MGCRGDERVESVGSDIDYGVRPPPHSYGA